MVTVPQNLVSAKRKPGLFRARRPFTAASPTATLRSRRIRCNRPTCNACPHGPYLYAILRIDGRRRDISLGPSPTAATFYRKLARHLPGEQIRNLIQQWKEERP